MVNRIWCIYILFFISILISCNDSVKHEKKPNVILIISDQWSTKVSDGSGNYSNGIKTPNLDKLASMVLDLPNRTLHTLCVLQLELVFLQAYIHIIMM